MAHRKSKKMRGRGRTRRRDVVRRRGTRRRGTRRVNTYKIYGGNYSKDITTQTYLGVPMKPLNKVVTSIPGFGTMSVSSYAKMMEDYERNGFD